METDRSLPLSARRQQARPTPWAVEPPPEPAPAPAPPTVIDVEPVVLGAATYLVDKIAGVVYSNMLDGAGEPVIVGASWVIVYARIGCVCGMSGVHGFEYQETHERCDDDEEQRRRRRTPLPMLGLVPPRRTVQNRVDVRVRRADRLRIKRRIALVTAFARVRLKERALAAEVSKKPCTTEIHLQFRCAHTRLTYPRRRRAN